MQGKGCQQIRTSYNDVEKRQQIYNFERPLCITHVALIISISELT